MSADKCFSLPQEEGFYKDLDIMTSIDNWTNADLAASLTPSATALRGAWTLDGADHVTAATDDDSSDQSVKDPLIVASSQSGDIRASLRNWRTGLASRRPS